MNKWKQTVVYDIYLSGVYILLLVECMSHIKDRAMEQ